MHDLGEYEALQPGDQDHEDQILVDENQRRAIAEGNLEIGPHTGGGGVHARELADRQRDHHARRPGERNRDEDPQCRGRREKAGDHGERARRHRHADADGNVEERLYSARELHRSFDRLLCGRSLLTQTPDDHRQRFELHLVAIE